MLRAQLEEGHQRPHARRSYWDFTLPDQGMEDFLTAANSSGRTTIPNFSTIPAWLFTGPRILYPDDRERGGRGHLAALRA